MEVACFCGRLLRGVNPVCVTPGCRAYGTSVYEGAPRPGDGASIEDLPPHAGSTRIPGRKGDAG